MVNANSWQKYPSRRIALPFRRRKTNRPLGRNANGQIVCNWPHLIELTDVQGIDLQFVPKFSPVRCPE
jgi:hypothetical protein